MTRDITIIQAAAGLLQVPVEELKEKLESDSSASNNMPELLTIEEVEELTSLSYATLHRSIQSGQLSAVKVGRSLRFHANDVAAFLNECRGKTDNPPINIGEWKKTMSPVDSLGAASRYLKLPVSWLKEQIEKGRLPYLNVDNNIRVKKTDIDALFKPRQEGDES